MRVETLPPPIITVARIIGVFIDTSHPSFINGSYIPGVSESFIDYPFPEGCNGVATTSPSSHTTKGAVLDLACPEQPRKFFLETFPNGYDDSQKQKQQQQ